MFRRNYCFVFFLVALVMSLCFSSCTRRKEEAALTQDNVTVVASGAVETLLPEDGVPAALEPDLTSDEAGASEAIPTPKSLDESDSLPTGPVLIAREKVDDGFFADAAFFGNSLMEGLSGFGELENGAFFAHAKIALYNMDTELNAVLDDGGAGTLYQALTQRQYGKIYVLLGLNEIGWDADFFVERYEVFLDRLRQDEPEAEIYIMSLSPVTREVSETHGYFNMERVRDYNTALLALAERTGCWYLDLCQALAGEDGYLPAECAAVDGIHFTKDAYLRWADYLRTHYADSPVTDIMF